MALVAIVAAPLCLGGMQASPPWPGSDISLRAQFLGHEADFETIVKMAQQDIHVERIAQDFTWLDTDVSWPRKNVGITQPRWNRYRELFRRAGIPDGILNYADPPEVLFPIVSRGLVPAGQTKGIAYSPLPLAPVLASLDARPPARFYDNKGYVIAYKPIKVHWYIYYEQW
ncbi:MAG TPA: hypothetical protein VN788_08985 [Verrucomicrobiae bacterium]|nr:hypothetical protein [Verrucomicrobiae bacterium]